MDIAGIDSAFAVALHMHQPLIPAAGPDLRTAAIIGNLQWMLEHPVLGDNYNAPVFHRCYKRMGELIPELLAEGKLPRIMLDYSGTLLHGCGGRGWMTCSTPCGRSPATRTCARPWSGWAAPGGTPWPPPPRCGTTGCTCGPGSTTEHTVELPDGRPLERPHLPHRLVCTSSAGDTAGMVAVVKTQGSDTKLVGQLQPYDEAKGLSRPELAGRQVPPLVTRIADGENGGVMMNEFPPSTLR